MSACDMYGSEVSYDCKTWGDTQTEYGRSNGPPHLPHYAYNGHSPEPYASEYTEEDPGQQYAKVDDQVHPLHVATPLLHSLKPTRKAAETSL